MIIVGVLLCFFLATVFSQTPVVDTWAWFWVGGSDTPNVAASGTRGAAPTATSNPGARAYAGSWFVANTFYVFGGLTVNGSRNDMWSKAMTNNLWQENLWTFLKGDAGVNEVYSISNPSARHHAATFSISSTELLLHGGYGYGNTLSELGYLQNTWAFTISGSTWTSRGAGTELVDEPSLANCPSGRAGSATWSRTGAGYLYGGFGVCGAGMDYCSDMWKIDGSAWSLVEGTGPFWPQTDHPGARYGSITWEGAADQLFLFGGSNGGVMNDVWEMDNPETLKSWRCRKCPASLDGDYSHFREFDSAAAPKARQFGAGWTYAASPFAWGGSGSGLLGDLWQFSAGFNWKFLYPNETSYDFGIYSRKGDGSYDHSNRAPQREGASTFVFRASGETYVKLFVWGGFSQELGQVFLNDAWYMVDLSKLHLYNCFGRSRFDMGVCSGHGTCASEDVCTCDEGYAGESCATGDGDVGGVDAAEVTAWTFMGLLIALNIVIFVGLLVFCVVIIQCEKTGQFEDIKTKRLLAAGADEEGTTTELAGIDIVVTPEKKPEKKPRSGKGKGKGRGSGKKPRRRHEDDYEDEEEEEGESDIGGVDFGVADDEGDDIGGVDFGVADVDD